MTNLLTIIIGYDFKIDILFMNWYVLKYIAWFCLVWMTKHCKVTNFDKQQEILYVLQSVSDEVKQLVGL
jgi:hypothetical protein